LGACRAADARTQTPGFDRRPIGHHDRGAGASVSGCQDARDPCSVDLDSAADGALAGEAVVHEDEFARGVARVGRILRIARHDKRAELAWGGAIAPDVTVLVTVWVTVSETVLVTTEVTVLVPEGTRVVEVLVTLMVLKSVTVLVVSVATVSVLYEVTVALLASELFSVEVTVNDRVDNSRTVTVGVPSFSVMTMYTSPAMTMSITRARPPTVTTLTPFRRKVSGLLLNRHLSYLNLKHSFATIDH